MSSSLNVVGEGIMFSRCPSVHRVRSFVRADLEHDISWTASASSMKLIRNIH